MSTIFKDKKLLYALIGGATLLVGAAIISHMSGQVEESPIDQDLENLGPLRREEDGRYLDFEYFIKVFELSTMYAKMKFSNKKKEYVSRRRENIKNEEEYKKIVMEMTQEEEKVIESQMMDIINKLGITEQEFQQNAMYHGQDQMKQIKMMQVQQVQKQAPGADQYPDLTKEKCLEVFKVQVDIQMKQMEKMVNDPDMKNQMANVQNMSQESQMNMMMKAVVEQHRAQDQLHEQTGVEEEQLNQSIVKLKLENDADFRRIAMESQTRAMAMAQQAQGGMGGPPGQGPPMGMF